MKQPLAAVEALRDVATAYAAESERLRTLAPAVVTALRESGLLAVAAPAAVGGGEHGPVAQFEVIEALTRIDTATSWSLMISALLSSVAGAYLPEAGVREVFASGVPTCAGMLMPSGVLRAVPGGFRASGRWGSVARFATPNGSSRAQSCSRKPQPRTGRRTCARSSCRHRRSSSRTPGMRRGCAVPAASTITSKIGSSPKRARSRSLGCRSARRTELRPSADRDARAGARCVRSRDGPGGARSDHRARAEAQQSLAGHRARGTRRLPDGARSRRREAESDARAFCLEAFAQLEARMLDREPLTLEDWRSARLAVTHATDVAADVASFAFRSGGAGALYDASPLQRSFRDMLAASQHIAATDDAYEFAGKLLLGLAAPHPLTAARASRTA